MTVLDRPGRIGQYLAALEAALPGPARCKRALLAEAGDGLRDAAQAYRSAGLDPDDAERRAVADFGDVAAVAPAFAQEIGLRQARRTSRVLCLALPAAFLSWQALLSAPPYAQQGPHGPLVLAVHLAGVAALAVVLGALALPLTGRLGGGRLGGGRSAVAGRRVPRLVGTAAIVGGTAFAGGVTALLARVPATDPGPAVLVVASAAAVGVTAWSGATCHRTAPSAHP